MPPVAYARLAGLLTGHGPEPEIVACRGRVLDLNAAAARAGIRPGQRVRAARLACPGVAVRPFDAAQARERAEPFLRALAARTPHVEPDGPLGAYLALPVAGSPAAPPAGGGKGRAAAGPAGPFARAAAELAALAAELLPRCGHRLEIGLGPNRLVARIAADLLREPAGDEPAQVRSRARRLPVPAGEAWLLPVAEDGVAAFLAPLPLSRLPLEPATLQRLHRLGLYRVADAARLPPAALAGALGPEEALRVARLARGEDARPVAPAYPPPRVRAERRFPSPVSEAPSLQAALAGLAAELAAALQRRGQSAGELWLLLDTERAPVARVRRFTRAASDARSLGCAARRLLEREPPPAPVEAVALEARALERIPAVQSGLVQRAAERRDPLSALGPLAARLPAQALRTGSELEPPRRERLLACFDPLRQARAGPLRPGTGDPWPPAPAGLHAAAAPAPPPGA